MFLDAGYPRHLRQNNLYLYHTTSYWWATPKTLVMGRLINPFTDFGFHRIFGQEVRKELLIDFLNQLLKDGRQIIGITFQNPILQPETIDDRGKCSVTRSARSI